MRYFVLGFVGVLMTLVAWLAMRDPLQSLPLPDTSYQVETQVIPSYNNRHVEHVTLHSERLGDIGIIINLPAPSQNKKLPLIVVLGGLGTGENNIRYVGEAGNNVVVGYDWPMPVQFYSGVSFIEQIPDLYHRLMSIPAQVATAVDWISKQSWADTQHLSLLGFSLGALAAPAIQDVMNQNGQPVGWTILAYGGSPFGSLFINNPHFKPVWMRYALAPVIDLLLRPLQPTEHLPYLSGHFLVLQGADDRLIPEKARLHFWVAVPKPKDTITFEGNHMGVGQDKMELLQKIITASKKWLIESAAVNSI